MNFTYAPILPRSSLSARTMSIQLVPYTRATPGRRRRFREPRLSRSAASAAGTAGLSAPSSADALQSADLHVQERSEQPLSSHGLGGTELGHMVQLVCTSTLPISSTPATLHIPGTTHPPGAGRPLARPVQARACVCVCVGGENKNNHVDCRTVYARRAGLLVVVQVRRTGRHRPAACRGG